VRLELLVRITVAEVTTIASEPVLVWTWSRSPPMLVMVPFTLTGFGAMG
jgi:hypothetical protein